MTQINATLSFSLPEDVESDFTNVYTSLNQNGAYSLGGTFPYEYGQTKLELELSDTQWYKIEFINSDNNHKGPQSESVYGGNFSFGAPFLAVSTQTDGANYATTQDVYNYTGLSVEESSTANVSTALKRARAEIDYRTAVMGLDRFNMFDTDTARRKYNAALQILKEAEVCLAAASIYTNLSDQVIIESLRDDNSSSAGSISIGQTSISGDSLAQRNESIVYLATLAARYAAMAEDKLGALDQNSIRLVSTEFTGKMPRFRYPFNWA